MRAEGKVTSGELRPGDGGGRTGHPPGNRGQADEGGL